ncbi:hypothetical protein SAMN05421788_101834 [Filimonas lacunae]|uniref:Phage late control gene D protein (GPD) n=1 Tax=Filimonas lacunae TaxID=477680 RepID=A0A173MPX4_9BACT|nr:hypothetical protein [Filimonas lacunae]BAV09398.1 hypothetical protein FLA_5446 [Filimonas lacunae]SIS72422.1 hypothetical protein SAMN05421788_101834 [Filimonas lacunae]
MFLMTNSITIGGFKPFKCTSATWSRSMDNYADSAKIKLPALCRLVKTGDQYEIPEMSTNQVLKSGMPVTISCGYNGLDKVRFKGFIKQINFSVPLEIECEGYSFLLQMDKKIMKHNYVKTTVKKILQDLVADTSIKLSPLVPDIPVSKAELANKSGVQVLEWLKTNMLLTVYFNFDELYVGLRYVDMKRSTTVKHKLGWNVIKDNQLTFNSDKTDTQVNISLKARQPDGVKKEWTDTGTGNKKVLTIQGIDLDSSFLQKLRDDRQLQENQKGYGGKITGFLEPACDLNTVSAISDPRYIERAGNYVIESIEGSFDASGGRQHIGIGIKI